jgi:hypothetical protein
MGQTLGMTTRPRRLTVGLPLVVLVLAACGTAADGSTPASAAASNAATASAATSSAPSAAPSADPSVAPVSPDASTGVGQSDTEWGRIWDGVPEGFPRFTGARDADDATAEPVSDVYAVEGGDAAEISTWLQAAMETATYSTEGLSGPLEDGSFVLDSVGDGACRIQTSIVPMGGLVLVTVRYGADCPAS